MRSAWLLAVLTIAFMTLLTAYASTMSCTDQPRGPTIGGVIPLWGC